ncbi:MAG: type I methionyl aminopeptidase [Actinobacteria bacterium]|nr:MAG: type I methionyl aminopeptidase [Actinomycetota bacterium]
MSIICKSEAEMAVMRQAGKIVADTLEAIREQIRPGVRTSVLDDTAERFIRGRGGVPAFKGYRGFPASICVSIDEMVVHGIPGERKLAAGEIVSLDVGVVYKGYVADAASTEPVGEIDEDAKRLVETTKAALSAGIENAQVGNHLFDISNAIQKAAESAGFSVVREYVGHGIGRDMHEDPPVPNFGSPGKGPRLQAGMTLALEPMVNAGSSEVRLQADGWTVVTSDGKRSAHFEHTIGLTEDGPRILTLS